MDAFRHQTVLLTETVQAVQPHDGGHYVDCTLGGAGHSELLLAQSAPTGKLLAIDQDTTAIEHAKIRLARDLHRVVFVHANFRRLRTLAEELEFSPVDGIVFDLGVSSPQFDEAERGFSYRFDAPLDMRMDVTQPVSAAELVNEESEAELAKIFFEYGEEKFSRRIARAIVESRERARIGTTQQLADIVKAAIPAAVRRTGPHPARRVFQALRIAVNDELTALSEVLSQAFELLKPGGRIAVITFHSLEDRIVKQMFAEWCKGCICPPQFPVCQCHRKPRAKLVNRKPIVPSEHELEENSRSRSAKLRVIEKLVELV